MFCRSLFVLLSFFFRRFTASDNLFGIFKLVLWHLTFLTPSTSLPSTHISKYVLITILMITIVGPFNCWKTYNVKIIWLSGTTFIKYIHGQKISLIDWLMFYATFSNIPAISWRPVVVVEEAGVPGKNHRQWASNW
jgi:hypothetical protein